LNLFYRKLFEVSFFCLQRKNGFTEVFKNLAGHSSEPKLFIDYKIIIYRALKLAVRMSKLSAALYIMFENST